MLQRSSRQKITKCIIHSTGVYKKKEQWEGVKLLC